jgi:phosphate transport system substrate-binding protein
MSSGRKLVRFLSLAVVAVLSLSMAACKPSSQESVSLHGAGATFPAPLYQQLFAEYNKKHPEVKISYQSVGSGAGVNQFIAGTVTFGASDVAMTEAEIAQVKRGAILVPVTAGAIVIGFNIEGVAELKLSQQVLAQIFLGEIKTWNDTRIAELNPGVNLPATPVTVVHRSDGSGTTGVFTMHLSAVSDKWKNGPGSGKTVQWPVGIGAKGNEGVTAQLMQVPGSIGYIEVAYATQNNIKTATVQNREGNFVKYSSTAAAEALANIQLPDTLVAFEPNPAGAGSYPIVSYSWIMAYRQYDDAKQAEALRNVLNWAVTDGQAFADQLGYIPLPESVVSQLAPVIDTIGR